MRGNPKIDASNQTARVCIANSARFFILAIFGFPLNTPLPTRHARSPLTTAQGAPCQKRGFGAARYRVAREARFRATVIVALSALRSRLGLWLCYADTLPSRNLRGTNPHHSLRSNLLSMFALSCDRARGTLSKARSFGDCIIYRATVVVVLSAMSKFFLDFLCGCVPSPFSARVDYFYAGRSSASSEARNASGVP